MMQTDLEKLADRIEAADGPSRDLDLAIMRWVENIGGDPRNAAHYTSSIDAAMQLVPEGWRMAQLCERQLWFCRLETHDFEFVTWGKGEDWIRDITKGKEVWSEAKTPALALAAAAIRSRSKQ